MKTTFEILGFFFVGMLVLGFWFQILFLRILKQDHPDEWRRLGSPSLFLNNSIGMTYHELKFLFGRQFIKLNDRKLNSVCQTLLVLNVITMLVFIGLILTVPYAN